MASISTVENDKGEIVTTDRKTSLSIVEPGSLFPWVLRNPVPNRGWDNKFGRCILHALLDSSLLRAVVLLVCVLKVKGQRWITLLLKVYSAFFQFSEGAIPCTGWAYSEAEQVSLHTAT